MKNRGKLFLYPCQLLDLRRQCRHHHHHFWLIYTELGLREGWVNLVERWMQAFDDERQKVATDQLNGFSVDAVRRPISTMNSPFLLHNARNVFVKKPTKRAGVNRQKGSFSKG